MHCSCWEPIKFCRSTAMYCCHFSPKRKKTAVICCCGKASRACSTTEPALRATSLIPEVCPHEIDFCLCVAGIADPCSRTSHSHLCREMRRALCDALWSSPGTHCRVDRCGVALEPECGIEQRGAWIDATHARHGPAIRRVSALQYRAEYRSGHALCDHSHVGISRRSAAGHRGLLCGRPL